MTEADLDLAAALCPVAAHLERSVLLDAAAKETQWLLPAGLELARVLGDRHPRAVQLADVAHGHGAPLGVDGA